MYFRKARDKLYLETFSDFITNFSARYRRHQRQITENYAENGTFMIKARFSSHAWATSYQWRGKGLMALGCSLGVLWEMTPKIFRC